MKYKTSPEHEFLKLLGDLEYNWKTRTLNLLSLQGDSIKFHEVRTENLHHFILRVRSEKISLVLFTILILTWMISEVQSSTISMDLSHWVVTRKHHIVSVCYRSPSHNEALHHLATPGDHGLPSLHPESVRPGVHWRLLRLLRLWRRLGAKLLKISAMWTQKGDSSLFCWQLIRFIQMWCSGRKETDVQLSSWSVSGS